MRQALHLSIVLLGSLLGCLGQDYFPLEVGNQWVYRASGPGEARVVEVTRTEVLEDGNAWHLLEGWPGGSHWIRMSPDGKVIQFDRELRIEKLWYDFSAEEGREYVPSLPGTGGASIGSRSSRYNGPIGSHGNALRIDYKAADVASLEREYFIPYVGLVSRVESTGNGTVTYDLIYSRTGGVTVVSGPEISFGLAVDPALRTPVGRITVRNTTGRPYTLTYPSGQIFEFVVKDAGGETVYVWSADKIFPAGFQTENLTGEKQYVITLPSRLRAGRYTAEAWLTTYSPANKTFFASVGFELENGR